MFSFLLFAIKAIECNSDRTKLKPCFLYHNFASLKVGNFVTLVIMVKAIFAKYPSNNFHRPFGFDTDEMIMEPMVSLPQASQVNVSKSLPYTSSFLSIKLTSSVSFHSRQWSHHTQLCNSGSIMRKGYALYF
jgi:hypothetical protein